jgi:hypothetical protein
MASIIALPIVPAKKPRPPRSPSKKAAERAAAYDLFSRQLFFRFNVIRARMQAHGINWTCWLGLKLLAHCGLETWLGKPDEEAKLRRAAFDMPQRYIDAALANPSVSACCTEESIRKEPPIRLRFEQASAYGLLGECIFAVQSKSWGPFVGVEPIEPDFPFDGMRIQYRFHESSRYNRRFTQRQILKRRLGKGLRKLVGLAMENTQAGFLKQLSAGEEAGVRVRLRMGAREFWRVARGRRFIERAPAWVQLFLFDMMEDDHDNDT